MGRLPKKLLKKLNKVAAAGEQFVNGLDDALDSAVTKTFESIGKEFEYLCRQAVDEFYSTYTPGTYSKSGRGYDRTGGLYSMVHVEYGPDGVFQTTGPEYSTQHYHQDASYVYFAAFEKGAHGGVIPMKPDDDGKIPGNGKTLYWRNGQDFYQTWGMPAKTTIPINFRIDKKIENYKKEKHPQKWLDYWWAVMYRDLIRKSGLKDALR